MPKNSYQHLVPHSPEWRKARRENLLKRKRSDRVFTQKKDGEIRFMRDCDGRLRLAPGPDPKPVKDCLVQTVTSMLTDREFAAFMKLKPKGMTMSAFVRLTICEKLESKRARTMPTRSFIDGLPQIENVGKRGGPPPRASAGGGAPNLVLLQTTMPSQPEKHV